MNPFAIAPRRAAGARTGKLLMLAYSIAAVSFVWCQPAMALYAEVKPTLKTGADCVGKVSLLAPKLTSCAIAGPKMRIWCPNGQMFEGEAEQGGPAASLARSLCNMTQVP